MVNVWVCMPLNPGLMFVKSSEELAQQYAASNPDWIYFF